MKKQLSSVASNSNSRPYNKVLNVYVVHLIAARRYELIPRYACHMRQAHSFSSLSFLGPQDTHIMSIELSVCVLFCAHRSIYL